MTILLETGDIRRFPTVGDYASYARCVGGARVSNGKKKSKVNTKNGNAYLSWAFSEAAQHAIRYNDKAARFYQRKLAKCHLMGAGGGRWRTSWRGRAITSCATESPLTTTSSLAASSRCIFG